MVVERKQKEILKFVKVKTEKERENTQKGRKVLVTDKVNAFIDTFA